MKAKAEVFIKNVQRKLSGQGNQYYLVDFVETLPIKDENGKNVKREWNNVFCQPEQEQEAPNTFNGKDVEIIINFYTYDRKVGDKVYTDIKCNIISIVAVKEKK